KLCGVARTEHQRSAGCRELPRNLGAKPETCASDDCAPPGERHAGRPTEINERRSSAPSVAPRKRPASSTERPLMTLAASSAGSVRNSAESLATTSASAPAAAKRALTHSIIPFKLSGWFETCGS